METQEYVTMAALKAAMLARKPAMIVGSPGTGKSATIEALAKAMGYECLTLVGSHMEPSDVIGLPHAEHIMDDEEGNPINGTAYLMPYWQIRILQKKRVILFLDEFSNTNPSVRASWLTMLQGRMFPNGQRMPVETIVIGAMNAVEEAADGYALDAPTTNRMMFLSWNPSVASWLKGMREAWGQEVSAEEAEWRRKVAAFIEDNPGRLDGKPSDPGTAEAYGVDPNNYSQMTVLSSAWPSRRSWNDTAVTLAHTPKDDIPVQDMVVSGLVGSAGAAAFREWLIKNDSLDAKAVLANPDSVDWANVNLGDARIVIKAIADGITEENALQSVEFFRYLVEDAGRGDLGGPLVGQVIKNTNQKSWANSAEVKAAVMKMATKYRAFNQHHGHRS